MTMYNVITTLTIGENTSVLIDGNSIPLKNGVNVLDENGKTYEVLSVGMSGPIKKDELLCKTSLLIKGHFSSTKLYV